MNVEVMKEAHPTRIAFTVPGPPGHWRRARSAGKFRFTDSKTAEWKTKVAMVAAEVFGRPMEGPLQITITAVYPRTKALAHVTKRTDQPKHGKARLPYQTHPDVDNVAKGVCDALNGIAYGDDRQVCDAVLSQRYACMYRDGSGWHQEPPHTEVVVEVVS